MSDRSVRLERSGGILIRKFRRYLVPSLINAVAESLNEFVDSLLVAHLLDSTAMSVVGIGAPVMFIFCAVFVLVGDGGATLYATKMGEHDRDGAAHILGVSMSSALLVSCAILGLGLVFLEPICAFICPHPDLASIVTTYTRALLFSAPFIIGIMTLNSFFPAAGLPSLAAAVCIIANSVNLLMDWVYIRLLGMGVEGAAWATLTGHIVALAVVVVVLAAKRPPLYFKLSPRGYLDRLAKIAAQGSSRSIAQIGFSVKYGYLNALALSLGGTAAMTVFAVCKQTTSIVSIALAAVIDSMAPLCASLFGQRDMRGMLYVARESLKYSVVSSWIFVALFWLFPHQLFAMFNVTDPALMPLASRALRIFSLLFLLRCVYLMFTTVSKISGRQMYAFLISLSDGVIGPLLFGVILTPIFGLDGLWANLSVGSVVILTVVVIVNRRIAARSDKPLDPFLLIELPEGDEHFKDITVVDSDQGIAAMAHELMTFCEDHGISSRMAMRVGLVAEEMAVYTRGHAGRTGPLDIMTRIGGGELVIEFRSEGLPHDPLKSDELDIPENVKLLRGMADSIEYEYLLGMNSTRLKITKGLGSDGDK